MPFVQGSIRSHFAQYINDDEVAVVEAVLTRIAQAARDQRLYSKPSAKLAGRSAAAVRSIERPA
jgi:hypothetical protein